eukprot:EG_transcript_44522
METGGGRVRCPPCRCFASSSTSVFQSGIAKEPCFTHVSCHPSLPWSMMPSLPSPLSRHWISATFFISYSLPCIWLCQQMACLLPAAMHLPEVPLHVLHKK